MQTLLQYRQEPRLSLKDDGLGLSYIFFITYMDSLLLKVSKLCHIWYTHVWFVESSVIVS